MKKNLFLRKNKLCLVFFLAFLMRFFLLFTLPHVDVLNHVDWGIKFWQYGPKNFYEEIFWGISWPNQPPGSILLFALIAKLNLWIFQIFWWLNLKFAAFPSFILPYLEKHLHLIFLKFPFVLSDLGIGILIYKIVKSLSKKENLALLASSTFLFNPALIYNSAIWGQTDSLINLLTLAGLWFLWKKKFFGGFFCFFTSLYFKLSLIIFAPLMVLIVWQKRKFWLRWLPALGAVIGIFLLVSLPFVHHGNVFTWLWYLYTNRILPRQGDMLSGNAFNLWTLFYGVDLSLKENILVFGLTAKFWGRLMFLLSSGLITLIIIFKRKKFEFLDFLWLGIVYAFSAFLFLTNMHERYLYPIFPLLAILVFLSKGYQNLLKIFIIISVIYLANLYHLWWHPRWEFLVIIFTMGGGIVPRILSLINIALFLLILRRFLYEKKLA